MSSDYKYLAEVWPGDTTEAPSGLSRTRGDEMEYLSLIDWTWHPVTDDISEPAPGTLVEITPEQAQELLSDRQRFVRYWSYRHPNSEGDPENENRVYRRRSSPERMVDEVFGPANKWVRTPVIREFTGGHDKPDLIAIDRDTAEQLIHETRGITGATDL
ncbi:MAG TPA: hypothetical protein VGD71_06110 [Kribbella sp.]|jgi:hypothetical protein